MPPEPLPWDRKDFFRERRHSYDRPPEPMGGSVGRWRDSSSHGSSRNDFARWGFPSEFRRPPGHGRQGNWHSYSEEFAHGYGAARSCDRFVEDGGFRPYGPRGDSRYSKNFRENRGSYSHKDWRSQSWDQNNHHGPPSNSATSRLRDAKDQRNADDTSAAPTPTPHSNPSSTTSQPNMKELPEKTSGSNGPVVAQRSEKENMIGNTDWKPIRWSRSGGLTSKGSSFGHSSSSKTLPVENSDLKSEVPLKIATPSESPSGDAAACTTPTGSMEDISSRKKKPRLGWGEGLAKYEKKRVVGSVEGVGSSDAFCQNSVDSPYSPAVHVAGPMHSGPLYMHSPAPSLTEPRHSPAPSLTEHLYSPTPNLAERLQSPVSNNGHSPASNSAERTHSCMRSREPTHSPGRNMAEPLRSPARNLAEPLPSPTRNLAEPPSVRNWTENLAKPLHSPARNLAEPLQPPDSVLAEPVQSPASNLVEPAQSPVSNLVEPTRSLVLNLVEPACSPSSNLVEPTCSPSSNLAEKSPMHGFDCVSPATPSSVACSSSPGLQEKSYMNAPDIESKSSPSLVPSSQSQLEEVNVELNSSSDLGALLSELLQSIESISLDSGSLNFSALNKLLQLKGEILNTLELTESEIDSRENELRLLRSKFVNVGTCPESSGSRSVGNKEKSHGESHMIPKPPPLTYFSSGDVDAMDVDPSCNIIEDVHAEIKDEDVDSPGSATSKRTESLPGGSSGFHGSQSHAHKKDRYPDGQARTGAGIVTERKSSDSSVVGDERKMSQAVVPPVYQPLAYQEGDICSAIYLSNKETASRASEVFCNLLPSSNYCSEQVKATDEGCDANNLLVVERFLEMKQAQRFKERILALKYKAFLHLWKEDLRMLSIKKLRSTSLRRVESSSRSLHSGFKRHRSSIRSRFGSQGSNLSLVPASKVVNVTSKLLADPQIRVYRNELKMPALFLDEEKKSRFLSTNGLVQDPMAAEKERSLINPWTEEEKEIFLDQLAIFGKDFPKISSFIDHKTTADCVEFYYKNHKSDCFRKTKKKLDLKKQDKCAPANRYLMTSGKKWNREMNAASLDMLGAASAIVAHVDEDMESVKLHATKPRDKKYRRDRVFGVVERSSSFEVEDERETEAADVLAGICGSLSSEAMSSCITSSIDPADGTQEWKCQRTSSGGPKRPPTPEVTQDVEDDTCSDESCGDVDNADWTDEEKAVFVQAFGSYGRDFVMISQNVGTKSRDQCKVFFSKARKCLGLDSVCPGPGNEGAQAREADGGRSDTEGDACIVENDSAASSDKSGGRMDENMPVSSNMDNDDGPNNINLRDELGDVERLDLVKPEGGDSGMELLSLHHGQEKPKENSKPSCPDGDADGEVENLVRVQDLEDSSVPVASCLVDKQETVQHIVSELASASFEPSEVTVRCGSATENGGHPDQSAPSSSFAACGSGREERMKRSASTSDLSSGSDMWRKNSPVQEVEPRPIETRPSITSSIRRTDATNAQPLQVYFKKCNRASTSTNSVRSEPPALSSTHSTVSGAARLASDAEKQSGNGGVKLFGQILSKSSSVEKNSSSIHRSDNNKESNRPRSANGLDMVSTGHEMEKELLRTSGTGSDGRVQSFPARSYGFWDGTRIRTGFSALPDSAMLLAKYPSAFSNHDGSSSPSLSSIDPLRVQQAVNSCEPSLSSRGGTGTGTGTGTGFIRGMEMCSTSTEAKAAPDLSLAFPSQHNRNGNGFEVVSGLQQIKMNMVHGDANAAAAVVPPCAPPVGLTDPVTALKLHYARTQKTSSHQNGGGFHGGSGGREEVTWRGQNGQQHRGDLGR